MAIWAIYVSVLSIPAGFRTRSFVLRFAFSSMLETRIFQRRYTSMLCIAEVRWFSDIQKPSSTLMCVSRRRRGVLQQRRSLCPACVQL